MDNLTHSLFGLTLARTSLGRAGPGTTSALLLASNAPDIDIVTTAGGAAAYLQWHRGPTHGPLGIVGLGLVVATVVWAVGPMGTRDAASQRAGFGKLCTVSILGVLLHVLMDLPTSYGTRLLSPFDWHWFALDWLPIIDVYLLGILGTGLALGQGRAPHATSQRPRLRPHTARRAASLALSLTAAFYAGRAASHRQALAAASTVLAPLPPRCAPPPMTVDRWPPDAMLGAGRSSAARCLMDLAAIPDFFSPFRWRLIAQMPDRYEISDTDLLARRRAAREHVAGPPLRRAAAYENSWTEAVAGASRSASAQVFLGFSRFPAARWRVDDSGVTTVQWTDLRFVPPPSIDQSGRNLFFTITVRLDASGRILDERLGS